MKNKKRIIIWSIIIILLATIAGAVYYFTITHEKNKRICNHVQCADDQEERCTTKIDGTDCHCRCKPLIGF